MGNGRGGGLLVTPSAKIMEVAMKVKSRLIQKRIIVIDMVHLWGPVSGGFSM